MEIDCKGDDDITSDLLLKFSCMNTTEKDVLVQQFRTVLGEKGIESNAEFWLDMNNWNLESAVCAYYDFEAQNGGNSFMLKLPSSQFSSDPSFCDKLPPNTPFIFRFGLTNNGGEDWPIGCSLRFIGGTAMSNEERILLPALGPGHSAEIRLSLLSPKSSGCYQCKWRPSTLTGQFFGEMIFIIINVVGDVAANDAEMMDEPGMALSDASCAPITGQLGPLMSHTSTDIQLPPSVVIPQNFEDPSQFEQQQQQHALISNSNFSLTATTTTTTIASSVSASSGFTNSSPSTTTNTSSSSSSASVLSPTDNSMDAM